MLAYGTIKLGSNVISEVAFVAIGMSFCSLKKESKVFNECVREMKANVKNSGSAVRFYNDGEQETHKQITTNRFSHQSIE